MIGKWIEGKPLLRGGLWPFLKRFERHEELDVVKSARIGAVVRPADLRDDDFDLGILADDGTRDFYIFRNFLNVQKPIPSTYTRMTQSSYP